MTKSPPRDRSLAPQLALQGSLQRMVQPPRNAARFKSQGSLQRMVQPPRNAARFKSAVLWSAVIGGIILSLLSV